MTAARRIGGSFRDPSGQVFENNGRILRSVSTAAAVKFDRVLASGLIDELVADGSLVPTKKVSRELLQAEGTQAAYALEHERIPFVTYPYEWSFGALREAALLHLKIQERALAKGVTLSDASAYNVQFVGAKPVFIDALSFIPYEEGMPWAGHRQFCEQFLNPLLMYVWSGVPHHALFRGRLEGVPNGLLLSAARWRHKLSLNALAHVFIPAWSERALVSRPERASGAKRPTLASGRYLAIVQQLSRWISALSLPTRKDRVWTNYASDNSYSLDGRDLKVRFVRDAILADRPRSVLDIGCNTGEFSRLALEAHAGMVVGLEADPAALELAFANAQRFNGPFLPLYCDTANPSPSQGWLGRERESLNERVRTDFALSLAVIHHMAIARNLPLAEVIEWILSTAPAGVIEFVGKQDPMVKVLLSSREDIFPDYTREEFLKLLEARVKIVATAELPSGDRTLVHYRAR